MTVRPSCAPLFLIAVILVFTLPVWADQPAITSLSETPFGTTPDGQDVMLFTLTNAHGLRAKVITYGAILVSLDVPDRHGVEGTRHDRGHVARHALPSLLSPVTVAPRP